MLSYDNRSAQPLQYIACLFFLLGTFSIASLTGFNYFGIFGAFIGAFLITEINVNKQYIAFSILLSLSLQNLIIGIFGHLGNQFESLVILTQVPFLFLFFTYSFLILKRKIFFSKLTICIGLLLLTVLFAATEGGGLSNMVLQVRNLTTFYFAFEVGRYSLDSPLLLKKFIRMFLILAIVMFLSGIVLLIGGFQLYSYIGIRNVYFAKGLSNEGITGMPGRFTTDIFNIPIVRMGSLYFEPVTLSYFFSAAFVCSYIIKWTKSIVLSVTMTLLMGVAILLTGGKGGMLVLASVLISTLFFKIFSSKFIHFRMISSFWLAAFLSFLIIGVFSNFYGQEYAGPSAAHFDTISQTWTTIVQKPFGHGLAQGGFDQTDASFSDMESTGAESALMSFGYQLGIQGLIALFLCFYEMTKMTISNYFDKEHMVLGFIPFALFAVFLFQLNTYTPQAIVPFMFIAGSLAGFDSRNKERRSI
ncbi:hypothetical protein ATX81_07425 [Oenococcus oeni]|nr:hypothetical protein [Oenococcus oeni]EJO00809.1 hypothetical protein AWRIB318_959 [Oenococcus oeni AWRIB318]EKP90950.1 hypothetical protein AWRIB202_228 [Oenococcus oeni AWRIB202]OIK64120.1 hypothetical protein ATW64_07480 [Oenococcus oeni]OIK73298.1 hypothetical protein ATW71_07555 [Oenococcus oeni]OIK76327.1 hypothetical protein ATW72_07480 [Oenococcus oeni]